MQIFAFRRSCASAPGFKAEVDASPLPRWPRGRGGGARPRAISVPMVRVVRLVLCLLMLPLAALVAWGAVIHCARVPMLGSGELEAETRPAVVIPVTFATTEPFPALAPEHHRWAAGSAIEAKRQINEELRQKRSERLQWEKEQVMEEQEKAKLDSRAVDASLSRPPSVVSRMMMQQQQHKWVEALDFGSGGGEEQQQLFVSRRNSAQLLRNDSLLHWAFLTLPERSPEAWSGSCIAVGSSASVLRSSAARADERQSDFIDQHRVVLRFNQAPLQTSEADYRESVGYKTTHRLLNSKWTTMYYQTKRDTPHPQSRLLLRNELANTTLIVSRTTAFDYEELVETISRQRPDIKVLISSPRLVSSSRRLLTLFWKQYTDTSDGDHKSSDLVVTPSTGFVGLYALLQACDKVSVCGFSPVEEATEDDSDKGQGQARAISPAPPRRRRTRSSDYHYFKGYVDSEQLRPHPHHRFDIEAMVIRALSEEGLITMC